MSDETLVPARPYHEHMLEYIQRITNQLRSVDPDDSHPNPMRFERLTVQTLMNVIIGAELPTPPVTAYWPSVMDPGAEKLEGTDMSVPDAFLHALAELYEACNHEDSRILVHAAIEWIDKTYDVVVPELD